MLNNKLCSIPQWLPLQQLIQLETLIWSLLLQSKELELYHIYILRYLLISSELTQMDSQYPLVILYNTYLLAKLYKTLLGMQLEHL